MLMIHIVENPQCHQLGPRVRSPQRGAQKDGHGHCQRPVMVSRDESMGFERAMEFT